MQSLLSRIDAGERVTFDELLRAELSAQGSLEDGSRISLEGTPGIRLGATTIQTLALAIHELATNAAKYGALRDHGHLLVRWWVERAGERQRLKVEWSESGVAMPAASAVAAGGGYGRELIERALPYQLNAETSLVMGENGVRCTIALPI